MEIVFRSKQRGVTWNLLFPERGFVSMLTLKTDPGGNDVETESLKR